MNNIKKYRLREEGIPYYYEYPLTQNPGVSLKMIEVFDEKGVRWGVREEFVSITGEKFCAMTPLFDNLVDEKGIDRERIIYLKDFNFLIHGKLNGNEILGRINKEAMLDKKFFEKINFDGENIHISDEEDKKVRVSFIKNGVSKQIYFDCEKFAPYGNDFDVTYVNSFFIKSYQVNNRISVFVGKANFDTGEIYPKGYDIVRAKYIDFPLDKDGFINENEMIKNLSNDTSGLGLNIEFYKGLNKDSLILLLFSLDVEGFDVCQELDNQVRRKYKLI